jgi:TrmH family RNA methyltransferase
MLLGEPQLERCASYFALLSNLLQEGQRQIYLPASMKELLKHARSLQQKKFRDQHGQFLVQGPKVVGEALCARLEIVELLATDSMAEFMGLHDHRSVPAHELARIGTLESGNEVIAIVRKPEASPVLDLGADELVLALDGISDPGNLGTVIRVAAWFGIQRVWCSAGSVEVYNPKCVQASMGALFHVRTDHLDLPQTLHQQQEHGAAVYLASMEGRSVFAARLERKAILVLGSESHGLSEAVMAVPHQLISIPGGGAESLNVAMAASALCMEFTRQRSA